MRHSLSGRAPGVVLIAAAVWSILPPYIGPLLDLRLGVSSAREIIDHAVPGGLAVVWSLLAFAGIVELPAVALYTGCALSGLWITLTHISPLLDAGDPGHPWGAVLLHSTAGPMLLGVAMWMVLREPERP